MGRIRAWDGRWTPAGIYLCTVLAWGLAATLIRQPGFTDSYYYYHVAHNLQAGRGLVEDMIWNYLYVPDSVTHASNSYWGPLASLLVLPSFLLFGPSFRAAQVPMVLLAGLVPVLSYTTARCLLGSRRQALIAALLTIGSGLYLLYWTVPEGYVPFAVAGATALLAMSKGLSGSVRWSALAGAATGFTQLARSDGLLLLGVFALLAGWKLAREGEEQRGVAVRCSLAALGTYCVIVAPWLYRNWLQLGSPFFNPGLKTLFLREYNDVFTYGSTLDAGYFFATGWQGIITSKIRAAAANLGVLAQALSFYLVPLTALGVWSLRRHRAALPFLVYGATLYGAMTLLFTMPGPLGSLLHSLAALLPFLMAATAKGLARAIETLLRRRPHLDASMTRRVLGAVLVAAQLALTLGLGLIAARDWETRYSYALYPEAIDWLSTRLAPEEPVMILDPAAYWYFSARPAIAVPNNDPRTVVEVARRFGARYVVLERTHFRPLEDLYRGEEGNQEWSLRIVLTNERGQELKIYELG